MFHKHTDDAPFRQDMSGGVISYEIKKLKPYPEIYQHLLQKYNLIPEECLFFDDRAENTEGARKQGIHAITVTSRQFLIDATSTMESMTESMSEMIRTVSLAISLIAGISLLVGGIGVMNIMLVSITERTREIGTRKALGATNGSIRLQFIIESMVLCVVGGCLGIALGLILGSVAASVLGYSATAPVAAIMIAVLFSMVVGVFFGYYPANKAARLDPIEALRYE